MTTKNLDGIVMTTKKENSKSSIATKRQGPNDVLREGVTTTEDGADVVMELKPSHGKSPRRTSNQQLQVVEEGRTMDATERWSCPQSCAFATKGHHGLGCTRIHKDFDFELCDLSEHHFVNQTRRHDHKIEKDEEAAITPECTNSTIDLPEHPARSVSFEKLELLPDNDKRLRYRRRAQCLLMVSLTLGTLILLLVWLLPPTLLREGDERESQGLEQTPSFTEAGSIAVDLETEPFAEP